MTSEERVALSFSRDVADIERDHGVFLVRDIRSGHFFVKKVLSVYHAELFRHLQEHPVPGIPRIYFSAEYNGLHYCIEEYVSGRTLEELLDREAEVQNASPEGVRTPFLPEEKIAEYCLQLLDILEVLHGMDPAVVHRDIKPGNVMVTEDGRVFLLDLNAARYADKAKPKDTVFLGTQGYAAPEQYGFGASDQRADIYALGMLMNTCLYGVFTRECTYPGALGNCIRRCIQLGPKDRYQSVKALRRALLKTGALPRTPRKLVRPLLLPELGRFLPPGFRSGNPLYMASGIVGYLMIFFVCAEAGSLQHPMSLPMRTGLFLILLLCTLFSCNYLDAHRFLPGFFHRNRLTKLLGIVLADCLIIVTIILILTFIPGARTGA